MVGRPDSAPNGALADALTDASRDVIPQFRERFHAHRADAGRRHDRHARGVALPVMKDMTASIKLNEAARMVEREMQDARLKAVSSNRVIRVRHELSGGRLHPQRGSARHRRRQRLEPLPRRRAYPFPPPDDDIMTRPNFDGPVRTLPERRDGDDHDRCSSARTARRSTSSPACRTAIATPVTVTISRNGKSKTVTVNNVGKVQLQ